MKYLKENNSNQSSGSGSFLLTGLLGIFFLFGLFFLFISIQLKPLSIQPSAIVGVIFCLPAIVAWIILKITNKQSSQVKIRQQRYPNQPWLWKKEWENGKIKASVAAGLGWTFLLFLAALAWNGAGWLLFSKEYQPRSDIFSAPLVEMIAWGGASLIGLLLIFLCIKKGYASKASSKIYFQLQTIPGVIGGQLNGQVETIKDVSSSLIKVTLSCSSIYSKERRSKMDVSSHNIDILWEEEQEVEPIYYESIGTVIPVSFTIPGYLPEVGETELEQGKSKSISWWLKIISDSVFASFYVPVYITHESAEGSIEKDFDRNLDDDTDNKYYTEYVTEDVPEEINVLNTATGGVKYSFNHLLQKIPSIIPIIAFLIFSCFLYFFIRDSSFMGLRSFSAIFIIFYILFGIIVVAFIFFKNKLTASIEIDANKVIVATEIFSQAFSKSLIKFSDYRAIVPTEEKGKETMHGLQILKKDSSIVPIAIMTKNKETIEFLVGQIEKEVKKRSAKI